MADFEIREVRTFEEFTRLWERNETDARLYWQLLGQLNADEVLVELPEWLVEEKVGFVDGATPRAFFGRIEDETQKAIRLADSAAAKPLLKTAHSIHRLEQEEGTDRNEWLDRRLAEHRRAFASRDGSPSLREAWIPKSQIKTAIRRVD